MVWAIFNGADHVLDWCCNLTFAEILGASAVVCEETWLITTVVLMILGIPFF